MSGILTDLSPSKLVEAIEENLCANYEYLARVPGAGLRVEDDLVCFWTGIPHPMLNGVIRSRLAPRGLAKRIRTVLAEFAERQVPMIWWTGPETRPPDLGEHLLQQGLVYSDSMPGMAADLAGVTLPQPSPADLRIEEVADTEDLRHWSRILALGFSLTDHLADAWLELNAGLGIGPHLPWRLYLGWLGERPVATSALFLGAGVAGIYCVGTAPEARGRGIGGAMVVGPAEDARRLGYRAAILHSSQMGHGIYRRLGFQEYCRLGVYTWWGP